jgi:glutathione-regulated potassium-efflux system protein KefB
VRRFGSKAFYGDASRPEILDAAQAHRARAFVLAIDNAEAALETVRTVKQHYPDLPIYARARDREHVYKLMDLGVTVIRRETYLSALDLTREVLRGLGSAERDVRFTVDTFRTHDEKRLADDYKHYTDMEKMQAKARSDAEMLAKLLDDDAVEQATQAGEASRLPRSAEAGSKAPKQENAA